MCFWKKKKEVHIDSKFQKGDLLMFKYRNDIMNGYVYKIYLSPSGEVMYDIQIGGECPAVINNIPETEVVKKR